MSPRAAANVCIFDGVPRWIRVMLFEKGLCASSFCSNEVLNWVAVKGDFFSPSFSAKACQFFNSTSQPEPCQLFNSTCDCPASQPEPCQFFNSNC